MVWSLIVSKKRFPTCGMFKSEIFFQKCFPWLFLNAVYCEYFEMLFLFFTSNDEIYHFCSLNSSTSAPVSYEINYFNRIIAEKD